MTGFAINIAIDLGTDGVPADVLVQNNFELETGSNFLLETGSFFLLET